MPKDTKATSKINSSMYFPRTLEYYHREYFPIYYRIYYMQNKK